MGEQQLIPFPYEFEELDPEEKLELKRIYDASAPYLEFARVAGYLVLKPFEKDAKNIYNMPLRSSDIFVASYQRSGTTWTQELVWLLASNLDYATAEAVSLTQRYAFLDYFMFFVEEQIEFHMRLCNKPERKETLRKLMESFMIPASGLLAAAPSPRFIKTHLPMSLLPPYTLDTAKVVYVARDPRDVAVSSFHHSRLFKWPDFPGDFKDFWNLFIKDLFTLTPYFGHIKEAWEKRNHPNMLFLFYEELSQDLLGTVQRVSNFLGKEVTGEELSRLCGHLQFDNFKNNKSVNLEALRDLGIFSEDGRFIRKGKAGGWRDYFDAEMTEQAKQWMADNLRDTDLRFPHLE